MNGLDLARRVRSHGPSTHLLASGHHHSGEDALPERGGFVRQPWTRERLIETIQPTLDAAA